MGVRVLALAHQRRRAAFAAVGWDTVNAGPIADDAAPDVVEGPIFDEQDLRGRRTQLTG